MRSLSLAALAAAYAQETGEVLVYLLTISHPALAQPIRICSNYLLGGAQTVSQGQSFSFFPLDARFPLDRADQPPTAKLILDNIDRSVGLAIEAIPATAPPTLLLQLCLADQLDTIEASFNFTMRDVQIDAEAISATLAYEQFLSEPFPGLLVTPSSIPGVFQNS